MKILVLLYLMSWNDTWRMVYNKTQVALNLYSSKESSVKDLQELSSRIFTKGKTTEAAQNANAEVDNKKKQPNKDVNSNANLSPLARFLLSRFVDWFVPSDDYMLKWKGHHFFFFSSDWYDCFSTLSWVYDIPCSMNCNYCFGLFVLQMARASFTGSQSNLEVVRTALTYLFCSVFLFMHLIWLDVHNIVRNCVFIIHHYYFSISNFCLLLQQHWCIIRLAIRSNVISLTLIFIN